jgi:hypothetical protein
MMLPRECFSYSERNAVIISPDRAINTNVDFFGRDHSPPEPCTNAGSTWLLKMSPKFSTALATPKNPTMPKRL